MEMRWYRKILRNSNKAHVTNEEVRAKIQQAIEPHEDLLTQTSVVWSCLPFIWSGQTHLARHNERGKKTLQTEEEVGRQHQEIGLEFGKSQRAAENRKRRGKQVVKSTVVPQRPPRLRDR